MTAGVSVTASERSLRRPLVSSSKTAVSSSKRPADLNMEYVNTPVYRVLQSTGCAWSTGYLVLQGAPGITAVTTLMLHVIFIMVFMTTSFAALF